MYVKQKQISEFYWLQAGSQSTWGRFSFHVVSSFPSSPSPSFLPLPSPPLHSPPSPIGADTAEHLSGLLHCAVDLRNSTHRFAILDISQRLGADRWSAIARKLCLQEDDIQRIQKAESCVEERYYKMLKQWVKLRQDGATFAALQDALTSCNQTAAVSVVVRRLQIAGPTLT